jgi:hypothetical protein
MPCIALRGRLCGIFVLNVHAPTEDKSDNTKFSFYQEMERLLDQFPKHFLRGFSAKVGGEHIFEPTTGNESLHEIRNDSGLE